MSANFPVTVSLFQFLKFCLCDRYFFFVLEFHLGQEFSSCNRKFCFVMHFSYCEWEPLLMQDISVILHVKWIISYVFLWKELTCFLNFVLHLNTHPFSVKQHIEEILNEIFRHTCLQSHLQTSPPTPQKSYPKFRNPRTTFENTPVVRQKCHSAGGPQFILFYWNHNIFVS